MRRLPTRWLACAFIGLAIVLSGCSAQPQSNGPPFAADASPSSPGPAAAQRSPEQAPPQSSLSRTTESTLSSADASAHDSAHSTSTVSTQLQQTLPLAQETRVPVLYYHSVMSQPGNELRMPPEQFEEQIRYLAEQGYHSITSRELYSAFYGTGRLPTKPVLIQFDDGYRDNYTQALPILRKYGFVATVFVVSSFVDGDGYLTWVQLDELVRSGWEIGSHSVNHEHLAELDDTKLKFELTVAKQVLESRLNLDVVSLAYPFGNYNDKVIAGAEAAGYKIAFTTNRGWANSKVSPFTLNRIYCYANMGLTEFKRRLNDPNY